MKSLSYLVRALQIRIWEAYRNIQLQLLFYFFEVHLNGTKSKEELFNDVYGQIQNKIEELLKMKVHVHAYNCNSKANLLKATLKKA